MKNTDQSWINEPIYILPRVQYWIDQYSPGLKISVSEYSWGFDDIATAAVADAEVFFDSVSFVEFVQFKMEQFTCLMWFIGFGYFCSRGRFSWCEMADSNLWFLGRREFCYLLEL